MCVRSTLLNMTIMERKDFYYQDKLMQGRVGERGSECSERVTLFCNAQLASSLFTRDTLSHTLIGSGNIREKTETTRERGGVGAGRTETQLQNKTFSRISICLCYFVLGSSAYHCLV